MRMGLRRSIDPRTTLFHSKPLAHAQIVVAGDEQHAAAGGYAEERYETYDGRYAHPSAR